MNITRQDVVRKLMDCLNHRVGLSELVDWAERVMREGEFMGKDWETLRDIVSRMGLADVRAFGLTWEECEGFLERLGYRAQVIVSEVSA